MKYRIIYKDSYHDTKTIMIEATSFWVANDLGERMFKEKFVRCESLEVVDLDEESTD